MTRPSRDESSASLVRLELFRWPILLNTCLERLSDLEPVVSSCLSVTHYCEDFQISIVIIRNVCVLQEREIERDSERFIPAQLSNCKEIWDPCCMSICNRRSAYASHHISEHMTKCRKQQLLN